MLLVLICNPPEPPSRLMGCRAQDVTGPDCTTAAAMVEAMLAPDRLAAVVTCVPLASPPAAAVPPRPTPAPTTP